MGTQPSFPSNLGEPTKQAPSFSSVRPPRKALKELLCRDLCLGSSGLSPGKGTCLLQARGAQTAGMSHSFLWSLGDKEHPVNWCWLFSLNFLFSQGGTWCGSTVWWAGRRWGGYCLLMAQVPQAWVPAWPEFMCLLCWLAVVDSRPQCSPCTQRNSSAWIQLFEDM